MSAVRFEVPGSEFLPGTRRLTIPAHAADLHPAMVRSTQKEIRQRAPVWLLVLLALNFGLMSYDAKDPVTRQRMIRVWAQALASPLQNGITWAGGSGVGFFQRLANMRQAEADNERLARELSEARVELQASRAARDENDRLKRMLDFKQELSYGSVPARVIARDPSVWFNSITVNRGTMSGVDVNMPVVTADGIVGRVVAVSPVTAQVMLLTDERSAAGAVVGQLGASNAIGSVRGFGRNGLLEMRYVSGLEPVQVGDYVVSTGQDGIYPPGLSVGTVVEKREGSATTPHTIFVKPAARLDALQELLILQYHAPPRTAPERTLPNVEKGRKP